MSLLEKIEHSLENNDNVVCVHKTNINRANRLGLMNTNVLNYTNFIVAPKKSFALNKFVGERLQSFMLELIQDMEPTSIEDFGQEISKVKVCDKYLKSNMLKMGKLYFEEEVTGELYENMFLIGEGERGLNKHINFSSSKQYKKIICISPFPSKKIARRFIYINYVGYLELENFKLR